MSRNNSYNLPTVTVTASRYSHGGPSARFSGIDHINRTQYQVQQLAVQQQTLISACVHACMTFVGSMLYGPAFESGTGSVQAVGPFGAMGAPAMVTVGEGTFKAGTMVTWIRKSDGGAIKGTFKFDGDPLISKMQPFADMVAPGGRVVRTPISEYAKATGELQ
jgi:hypothetical protein